MAGTAGKLPAVRDGFRPRIGVVAGSAGKLGTVVDLVLAEVERAPALRVETLERGISVFRLFRVGGEEVLRLGRRADSRVEGTDHEQDNPHFGSPGTAGFHDRSYANQNRARCQTWSGWFLF